MGNRIYFKLDDARWVQNEKFQRIRAHLGGEFDLKDITGSFGWRRLLGQRFYTPCVFSSWRQVLLKDLWKTLPLHHCMASVSSHYNIGGGLNVETTLAKGEDPAQAFAKAIDILKRFRVVTVNSMRLYELLSGKIETLVYTPNGVDADFFKPMPQKVAPHRAHAWRVGWVGKIKGAKNYELVRELKPEVERLGMTLVEVALDKDSDSILTRAQMRDFYAGIDFYLCTSWHEGTPNPCLEAAAMGVPLITTRVGNMPELVRSGENGFLIEPTRKSALDALERARALDESAHARMSIAIRDAIERDWDWAKQVGNYRTAFKALAI